MSNQDLNYNKVLNTSAKNNKKSIDKICDRIILTF